MRRIRSLLTPVCWAAAMCGLGLVTSGPARSCPTMCDNHPTEYCNWSPSFDNTIYDAVTHEWYRMRAQSSCRSVEVETWAYPIYNAATQECFEQRPPGTYGWTYLRYTIHFTPPGPYPTAPRGMNVKGYVSSTGGYALYDEGGNNNDFGCWVYFHACATTGCREDIGGVLGPPWDYMGPPDYPALHLSVTDLNWNRILAEDPFEAARDLGNRTRRDLPPARKWPLRHHTCVGVAHGPAMGR
jgi:hypothetical protein